MLAHRLALRGFRPCQSSREPANRPAFRCQAPPAGTKSSQRQQRAEVGFRQDAEGHFRRQLPPNAPPPEVFPSRESCGPEDRRQRHGQAEAAQSAAPGPAKNVRVASMSRPIWAVSSISEGNVRSSRRRSKKKSRIRSPYTSEEKSRTYVSIVVS